MNGGLKPGVTDNFIIIIIILFAHAYTTNRTNTITRRAGQPGTGCTYSCP